MRLHALPLVAALLALSAADTWASNGHASGGRQAGAARARPRLDRVLQRSERGDLRSIAAQTGPILVGVSERRGPDLEDGRGPRATRYRTEVHLTWTGLTTRTARVLAHTNSELVRPGGLAPLPERVTHAAQLDGVRRAIHQPGDIAPRRGRISDVTLARDAARALRRKVLGEKLANLAGPDAVRPLGGRRWVVARRFVPTPLVPGVLTREDIVVTPSGLARETTSVAASTRRELVPGRRDRKPLAADAARAMATRGIELEPIGLMVDWLASN